MNNLQNKSELKEARKTIIYFSGIMGLAIIFSLFIIFFDQSYWTSSSSEIIKPIIDGDITVNEKSYIFYDFSVPSTYFHIKGNFTILDNKDEIISVYIMDEFNLFLWLNNNNPSMYFDSGKVRTGEIDVQIPVGGLFFLVFDNLSSEIQNSLAVDVNYSFVPSS